MDFLVFLLWPAILASIATASRDARASIYWTLPATIVVAGVAISVAFSVLNAGDPWTEGAVLGAVFVGLPTLAVFAAVRRPWFRGRHLSSIVAGWFCYVAVAALGVAVVVSAGIVKP